MDSDSSVDLVELNGSVYRLKCDVCKSRRPEKEYAFHPCTVANCTFSICWMCLTRWKDQSDRDVTKRFECPQCHTEYNTVAIEQHRQLGKHLLIKVKARANQLKKQKEVRRSREQEQLSNVNKTEMESAAKKRQERQLYLTERRLHKKQQQQLSEGKRNDKNKKSNKKASSSARTTHVLNKHRVIVSFSKNLILKQQWSQKAIDEFFGKFGPIGKVEKSDFDLTVEFKTPVADKVRRVLLFEFNLAVLIGCDAIPSHSAANITEADTFDANMPGGIRAFLKQRDLTCNWKDYSMPDFGFSVAPGCRRVPHANIAKLSKKLFLGEMQRRSLVSARKNTTNNPNNAAKPVFSASLPSLHPQRPQSGAPIAAVPPMHRRQTPQAKPPEPPRSVHSSPEIQPGAAPQPGGHDAAHSNAVPSALAPPPGICVPPPPGMSKPSSSTTTAPTTYSRSSKIANILSGRNLNLSMKSAASTAAAEDTKQLQSQSRSATDILSLIEWQNEGVVCPIQSIESETEFEDSDEDDNDVVVPGADTVVLQMRGEPNGNCNRHQLPPQPPQYGDYDGEYDYTDSEDVDVDDVAPHIMHQQQQQRPQQQPIKKKRVPPPLYPSSSPSPDTVPVPAAVAVAPPTAAQKLPLAMEDMTIQQMLDNIDSLEVNEVDAIIQRLLRTQKKPSTSATSPAEADRDLDREQPRQRQPEREPEREPERYSSPLSPVPRTNHQRHYDRESPYDVNDSSPPSSSLLLTVTPQLKAEMREIAKCNTSFCLSQVGALYLGMFGRPLKTVFRGKMINLLSHLEHLFEVSFSTDKNNYFVTSKIYLSSSPQTQQQHVRSQWSPVVVDTAVNSVKSVVKPTAKKSHAQQQARWLPKQRAAREEEEEKSAVAPSISQYAYDAPVASRYNQHTSAMYSEPRAVPRSHSRVIGTSAAISVDNSEHNRFGVGHYRGYMSKSSKSNFGSKKAKNYGDFEDENLPHTPSGSEASDF